MDNTYDWIDGTYDITKNGKRIPISDVVDELNNSYCTNEIERMNIMYQNVLNVLENVIRERNHLRAKLAEVYGESE